jgi:hypothetical protein
MLPSGSPAVATSVVELVGNVMVLLFPAVTTGGWFTEEGNTVIWALSDAVAPALSVTVSLKI